MPDTGFDRRDDTIDRSSAPFPTAPHSANLSLVMVVCSSQINRIVLSRIVERAGLKVVCETPDQAGSALQAHMPGMVIVDCGAMNDECHALAPALVAQRRVARSNLPMLVALSAAALPPESPFKHLADAIVAKPVTPEKLQPTIERLIEDARK
jgi:CheY-like chemotaxis protein